MKIAESATGERVNASSRAPHEAICPCCGGTVILRKRKKMGEDGETYYWRHVDSKNPHCPARWKLN
jgi:hypothetical protein